MDVLRAFIGIVVMIGIALLLGRLDHHKHGSACVYGWIFSIAVLLLLRFFL